MIAEGVHFKLHGKTHELRAITVVEFFSYTDAMMKIATLKESAQLSDEQILDLYYAIIHSVCDSVTRADVKKMTHAQAAALLKLVVEHVTGEAGAKPVEKKN